MTLPTRAALAATALLLTAMTPALQPVPGLECGTPGLDDRCEAWVVIDDAAVDTAEPYQQPSTMALSPDGGMVVAAGYGAQDLGDTQGQAHSRWRLVGIDAVTGEQRWLARPGPSEAYARPLGVTVSADNSRVFATGYASSRFGQRDADLLVAAVDAASGGVLWEATVDASMVGAGSTDVRGWFVAEAADGLLVVSGTYGRPSPGMMQGLLSVVLDAADGAVLDVVRAPGTPANGVAYPLGMEMDASRTMAVVGATSDGDGEYNIDMFAYGLDLTAAQGPKVAWRHRYDGPGHSAPDRVEAMGVSPDGAHVYLTGISGNDVDGPPFDMDYATTTIALDVRDGTMAWESRLDLGGDFIAPADMAVDGERVVFVGNRTNDGGNNEAFVATLDAGTGALVDDLSVPAAGLDIEAVTAVAFGLDELVLTGRSPHRSNAVTGAYVTIADTLTIGIDPTSGARTWTARHNSGDIDDYGDINDDSGLDVLTDRDGNVFVLGRVTNSVEMDRNFYDAQVLAYRRT